ncbi:TadE family protein [Aeromicrobium duanguangcaii]|uniref:TadE family protein n=1 Tax=Aeromicrobium duanguangcaii TaxID=2968086 RepID=UPI00201831C1|nr:TadE family protein [Aeromicrobium duanguangcaii]MCL3838780.1 pilus assembly protein [Aeromicrobium duanguangcaii]
MMQSTTWTRRSRRVRERGVAAVEFALIVPILMTIVIGIVEFGWAYNFRTQLNNATQIAARSYAIDRDWNVARANVTGLAPTAAVTKTINCTAATAGSPVTVTTTVTRRSLTNLFGANFTYTVRGVSQCS